MLFPWSCFAQDSESRESSLNWSQLSLSCWRMGELCPLSRRFPSACPQRHSQARLGKVGIRVGFWLSRIDWQSLDCHCLELIKEQSVLLFPLLLIDSHSYFRTQLPCDSIRLPGSPSAFQIWIGCVPQHSELPCSWRFLWCFEVVGLYFFTELPVPGKWDCLLFTLYPQNLAQGLALGYLSVLLNKHHARFEELIGCSWRLVYLEVVNGERCS